MSVLTTQDVIWQGKDATFIARIYKGDGSIVEQSDIDSISGSVYDTSDESSPVATVTPVVASTIYDTLQTGAPWDVDTTGYNFRYTVDGDSFPTTDAIYDVYFDLTPSSGESDIGIKFRVTTAKWLGG